MTWSFSIGRLFGSEIRIHATFFLLLLWIGMAAYLSDGPAAALENVVFVVAIFACVVAHEYGHVLTARHYGIETPDITLLPIGGMARLQRMPENPTQEIIVALAGPAVNVVIFVVLMVLFGPSMGLDQLEQIENPDIGFVGRLAAVNLFLALFNLLPAFPMDGGRVFRAVLSYFTDRLTATRAAAGAGQVLAFGFGFLGLTTGNVILLLIAIFIFMAAGAESSEVELRTVARTMLARDAMITSYESLAPDDSLQAAQSALIRTTQHEFPVMNADGSLAGFLTRNAIFRNDDGDRPIRRVDTEMIADVPAVRLDAGLDEVLDALHQDGAPAVAVTDKSGHMIGYVTRENIGELMVVHGRN